MTTQTLFPVWLTQVERSIDPTIISELIKQGCDEHLLKQLRHEASSPSDKLLVSCLLDGGKRQQYLESLFAELKLQHGLDILPLIDDCFFQYDEYMQALSHDKSMLKLYLRLVATAQTLPVKHSAELWPIQVLLMANHQVRDGLLNDADFAAERRLFNDLFLANDCSIEQRGGLPNTTVRVDFGQPCQVDIDLLTESACRALLYYYQGKRYFDRTSESQGANLDKVAATTHQYLQRNILPAVDDLLLEVLSGDFPGAKADHAFGARLLATLVLQVTDTAIDNNMLPEKAGDAPLQKLFMPKQFAAVIHCLERMPLLNEYSNIRFSQRFIQFLINLVPSMSSQFRTGNNRRSNISQQQAKDNMNTLATFVRYYDQTRRLLITTMNQKNFGRHKAHFVACGLYDALIKPGHQSRNGRVGILSGFNYGVNNHKLPPRKSDDRAV